MSAQFFLLILNMYPNNLNHLAVMYLNISFCGTAKVRPQLVLHVQITTCRVGIIQIDQVPTALVPCLLSLRYHIFWFILGPDLTPQQR